MKLEKRIYCIEGQHNWGKREIEPSVEPILQMLQKMGQWNYARRDCATQEELEFWLKNEWNTRCREGSILYIASHGSNGCIYLTNQEGYKNEKIKIDDLAKETALDCTNCLVHFGGCSVVAGKTGIKAVQNFIRDTNAACVTAYSKSVYWADAISAPAVALELMLFSSIYQKGYDFGDGRSVGGLRTLIQNQFNDSVIFDKCGLELFTRDS